MDTHYKGDWSQNNFAEWERADQQQYWLYDLIYIIFWEVWADLEWQPAWVPSGRGGRSREEEELQMYMRSLWGLMDPLLSRWGWWFLGAHIW